MPRVTGKVKWFNDAKGYGFITPEGQGKQDVFVHYSAVKMSGGGFTALAENDRVEFDIVAGPKGQQAADVVKLG